MGGDAAKRVLTAYTLFKGRLNARGELTFSLEEALQLKRAERLLVPLASSLAGYVLDARVMRPAGPSRLGFPMLYRKVRNLKEYGLSREQFASMEPGVIYWQEEEHDA